ncbi:MAG: glycosyl transferase group 1 [Microbacterium sp.]|nr:glycosyl transferase group 1 [Microbacterium sp.]|tara:strand:+ start:209 stop:1396 length:1188 start_codon:yes stop_codon:yes gene_type:complete
MAIARILVLTSTLPARLGDGTPAFVADLAIAMGTEFEVRIIAPSVPGGAAYERLSETVDVVRYRYFPKRWEDVAAGAILENVRSRKSRLLQIPPLLAALARAIMRETRRFRPDAIHAHWIIPQGLVTRVAAPRIPTVVTTLGGDLYALNSPPVRRAKTSVLRHAAAVTVMNEEMRLRAISLGADAERTLVIPMGARLAALEEEVGTSSPDGSPSPDPIRLLAVGRLVDKKGFDVLLSALAGASFPYRLHIVGDGPRRGALESQAAGMPVRFLGQLGREALTEEYRSTDIAVFPSRRASTGDQDGLPVALLEAMGSGCAVVASDLAGLNEAVEDAGSGLLVPEGDPAQLLDAIEELASDASLRLRLGAGARDRAESYSVEAVGERYRTLFRDALRL